VKKVERLKEACVAAETRERELEVDANAWLLLRDTLREVENEEGAHLGRALAIPVTARFEELTAGRYRGLRFDAALKAEALEAISTSAGGDEVLEALSVGTRDQLAALVRLTIADQIKSTIVLDDHLVHTDPTRLLWFRDVLHRTAVNTQVIVLTCRGEDYLSGSDLPVDGVSTDLAGGTIRAINMARALTRWEP
jgi:DNA repair protein SbcC/Rad50